MAHRLSHRRAGRNRPFMVAAGWGVSTRRRAPTGRQPARRYMPAATLKTVASPQPISVTPNA